MAGARVKPQSVNALIISTSKICSRPHFHWIRPLGRISIVVAMSVDMFVPFPCNFFCVEELVHASRVQRPRMEPLKRGPDPGLSSAVKSGRQERTPKVAVKSGTQKWRPKVDPNSGATSPKLYRSYYPHRSRDSMSPVCGIFHSIH